MTRRLLLGLLACLATASLALPGVAPAQPIQVLSVDVTPLVSPGDSRFGPQNTMGMALQLADTGGLFDVTEVTPLAFQAMGAGQLAAFDLIAVNNHPVRIFPGLGTTWHDVVGIESGGRVALISHDAVRFHFNAPAGSLAFAHPGPGVEPFGAPALVRQAALWAGGVPGSTGLLMFNDAPFFAFAGGQGWDNQELSLPAAWMISDLDIFDSNPLPGDGYTDIVAGFASHPLYAGLSDVRFDVDSISSFGGNITAASFHSVFSTYNAGIFSAAEVIVNAGDPNPGGLPVPMFPAPAPGTDGRAIALIREAAPGPVTACNDGIDNDGDLLVDHPDDTGCQSAVDLSEVADCGDGLDNDGDGQLDFPADVHCTSATDPSEFPDCNDGLDNDLDTFVDFPDDPGCTAPTDVSERPACDDGFDNDGDGDIDFPDDVGCRSATANLEDAQCSDGLDNDGDGLRDFDGGLSRDDGLPITAADPQCVGKPWRNREAPGTCGTGFELALLVAGLAALRGARRQA